jgi:hypothetical protein
MTITVAIFQVLNFYSYLKESEGFPLKGEEMGGFTEYYTS